MAWVTGKIPGWPMGRGKRHDRSELTRLLSDLDQSQTLVKSGDVTEKKKKQVPRVRMKTDFLGTTPVSWFPLGPQMRVTADPFLCDLSSSLSFRRPIIPLLPELLPLPHPEHSLKQDLYSQHVPHSIGPNTGSNASGLPNGMRVKDRVGSTRLRKWWRART